MVKVKAMAMVKQYLKVKILEHRVKVFFVTIWNGETKTFLQKSAVKSID